MKTTEIKPMTYSVKPEVDFESGEITFNEIINGFQNKYIREVLKTKEEATKKALIALGWTPPQPIAHDKAESGEMECAGFKRMMSEGSSDIMSKIIASENKSMERDFEIWWKQEWSFGEEPSAAKVYSILKKCTKSAIEERRKLEDKISDLEWKLVNDKATESINLPRLLDWIKNREKPAHLAFTESIERQIAYAVEMAVHDKAEACNKDDKLPDIYSTISYSSSAWNTSEQWHEVYCGGEIVFKTRNKYEANMFEAELKNKLSGFQGSREASKDNKIESLEEKVKELEKEIRYLRHGDAILALEAEVARLKGKLSEAREVMECALNYDQARLSRVLHIKIKAFCSSLNEADKTKENG